MELSHIISGLYRSIKWRYRVSKRHKFQCPSCYCYQLWKIRRYVVASGVITTVLSFVKLVQRLKKRNGDIYIPLFAEKGK
jgi:hypothetical protein